MAVVGLGNPNASIAVFIGNRPPLPPYQSLNTCQFLKSGEIAFIAQETGNHWRKIFNCFAKLAFELDTQSYSRWQALRDQSLLQAGSPYSLLFSKPDFSIKQQIKVFCGKTYFAECIDENVEWLDEHFAIAPQKKLLVVPYFDYRQLSNLRIARLVELIRSINN